MLLVNISCTRTGIIGLNKSHFMSFYSNLWKYELNEHVIIVLFTTEKKGVLRIRHVFLYAVMKVIDGSESGKYSENPEFTPQYFQKMHIWVGLTNACNFKNIIFEAGIRNSGPVQNTFFTVYDTLRYTKLMPLCLSFLHCHQMSQIPSCYQCYWQNQLICLCLIFFFYRPPLL